MKKLLSIIMLGFIVTLASTSFAANTKIQPQSDYLQLTKGQYMMPGRCWTDCDKNVVDRSEHHGYGGYDHYKYHNQSC